MTKNEHSPSRLSTVITLHAYTQMPMLPKTFRFAGVKNKEALDYSGR